MSLASPATYLVWTILSTLLGAFLVGHLWCFDQFKCLKWSNQPYSGAFKRVMTYSYLLSVPLLMAYSYGFAYMKYQEGITVLPGGRFIPAPYELWRKNYQDALFPFTLMFAFAWSLEMVTHLEELCFWLFLMNAGPNQPDWFRSPYSKVWVIGSVAAFYVPVLTALLRKDPIKCEAATFLAGSTGSFLLTLSFIPILWSFPNFMKKIKREGVDMEVVVRLTKFYELNVIRVIFRFLFVIPFIALGVDGVHGKIHPLNTNVFLTDLLAIIGGFGCVISSVITLLIFFPRSHEVEVRAREVSYEQAASEYTRGARKPSAQSHVRSHQRSQLQSHSQSQRQGSLQKDYDKHIEDVSVSPTYTPGSGGAARGHYLLTDSPVRTTIALPPADDADDPFRTDDAEYAHLRARGGKEAGQEADADGALLALPQMAYAYHVTSPRSMMRPGPVAPSPRARDDQAAFPALPTVVLTADNLQRHNAGVSGLNPIVHSFTSPIDLVDRSAPSTSRQRGPRQWA